MTFYEFGERLAAEWRRFAQKVVLTPVRLVAEWQRLVHEQNNQHRTTTDTTTDLF